MQIWRFDMWSVLVEASPLSHFSQVLMLQGKTIPWSITKLPRLHTTQYNTSMSKHDDMLKYETMHFHFSAFPLFCVSVRCEVNETHRNSTAPHQAIPNPSILTWARSPWLVVFLFIGLDQTLPCNFNQYTQSQSITIYHVQFWIDFACSFIFLI